VWVVSVAGLGLAVAAGVGRWGGSKRCRHGSAGDGVSEGTGKKVWETFWGRRGIYSGRAHDGGALTYDLALGAACSEHASVFSPPESSQVCVFHAWGMGEGVRRWEERTGRGGGRLGQASHLGGDAGGSGWSSGEIVCPPSQA
jgi:hypothetical protein